jgi:cytochrome c-type biogenesis protein CcmE
MDQVDHQDPILSVPTNQPKPGKKKYIIGGVFIVAAIIYLIVSSTQANAQYYYTIDEITSNPARVSGREIRVSGAVLGDTIQYDANALKLTFVVVNISGDNNEIEAEGGLAAALHNAVIDPKRSRMTVVYEGPRPDLLKNEAQAIMTGTLDENGVFHAQELLLKCPSRYEEELPSQAGK